MFSVLCYLLSITCSSSVICYLFSVTCEVPVGMTILTFTPLSAVAEHDETEYLLSSPANRERLEKAIKNISNGKNLITFKNLDEAIQQAEETAAVKRSVN